MSDRYTPIRAYLDAAAREFNEIVDALARSSGESSTIVAGRGFNYIVGRLEPAQVAARFKTLELSVLLAPAVQCAAAGPLKKPLKRLVEKMKRLQLALREKAIQAEDASTTLPGDFVEKYCQAVAELRNYTGHAGPALSHNQDYDRSDGVDADPPAPITDNAPADPFLMFKDKQRALLLVLHGRGHVTIDSLLKSFYKSVDANSRDALSQVVKRTNRKLTREELPYEIKKVGETYALKPTD
jgi:hypothetical protein